MLLLPAMFFLSLLPCCRRIVIRVVAHPVTNAYVHVSEERVAVANANPCHKNPPKNSFVIAEPKVS